MINTIIGIILLIVPFLLVVKFKDKKLAPFFIFTFLIAFHLVLALVTQALGIFTYPVILGANILVCLIIIFTTNFKSVKERIKTIKVDWVLIFIIIVIFLSLFAVHNNYTGKTSLANAPSYFDVKNMNYPYPYFSDEWYAVSLIQDSIDNHRLPLYSSLKPDTPLFANLELCFHSFISEIILLLSLNPLTQYSLIALFTGLIVCLLVYFILKFNRVRNLTAGIGALGVLYIVNGANLPGIWYIIPLIMGLICMLLGFIFLSQKKFNFSLITAVLVLLFYPPLFVFYTIAFFVYIFTNKELSRKQRQSYLIYYLSVCIGVALFLGIFALLKGNVFSLIWNKLFYETFTPDAIPNFSIFKIIPWPILIFGALGIWYLFKRKVYWLMATLLAGAIYWGTYSFSLYRFIIEYERVVVTTSILFLIVAGFGLHYFILLANKNKTIRELNLMTWLRVVLLIAFFVLAFSYTNDTRWTELKLYHESGNVFSPAAPANAYLHPDDLRLFGNIKGKNFLSIPWKGTVIGVATGNYPLSAKPGTLNPGKQELYFEFLSAGCDRKLEIAIKREVNYVYSAVFDCPGFIAIGESAEQGLVLYEFLKD